MNQRELGELRRRFRPEKSAISRVYGCYVNSSREIIAYIDQSLGLMPQEEAEKYLGLLKKALSGTLGRNLIDIVFSTQQVADSEEHRLLSALRNSELKDAEAREAFYQKVIAALDMGEEQLPDPAGGRRLRRCPTGAGTARWTGTPARRCSATSSAPSAR